MNVEIDRLSMTLRTRGDSASESSQPSIADRDELKEMLRPLVVEIIEETLASELGIRGR